MHAIKRNNHPNNNSFNPYVRFQIGIEPPPQLHRVDIVKLPDLGFHIQFFVFDGIHRVDKLIVESICGVVHRVFFRIAVAVAIVMVHSRCAVIINLVIDIATD